MTAFDVSLASVAMAQARAEECGVDIELYQADLTKLDAWDRRFDVVVCTGVLHHLDDPLLGWRNLVRLLSPGGVMLVGLYSRLARTGVRAAQDLVRAGGLAPTVDGIAEARTLIMELPDGHPGRDCLLLGDFYNLGGCRDMLFHVREHDSTLGEIAVDVDTVGLEFIGLDVRPAVRSRYRSLFGGNGGAGGIVG